MEIQNIYFSPFIALIALLTIITLRLVFAKRKHKLSYCCNYSYNEKNSRTNLNNKIHFFRFPEDTVDQVTKKKLQKIKTNSSNFSEEMINDIFENANVQNELNSPINKFREMANKFPYDVVINVLTAISYICVPIIAILCALFIPNFSKNVVMIMLGDLVDNHEIDLYLAQVSLTFLTISVMSIFSDTNEVVYWKNIVKQMLIEPPARCFKAYFCYSFFALAGATVCIITKYNLGLIIFFFDNIIALFNLTRIMISCYYGQNSKKKSLEKSLIKQIEEVNRLRIIKDALGNEKSNKEYEIIEEKFQIQKAKLREVFDDFEFYTRSAYLNGEYKTVCENLSEYGTLIAHVNDMNLNLCFDDKEYLEWYEKSTKRGYYDFLLNYYKEKNKRIIGEITSCASNTIYGNNTIIDNILINLCLHSKEEDFYEYKLLKYFYLLEINSIMRQTDTNKIWSFDEITTYANKLEYEDHLFNQEIIEIYFLNSYEECTSNKKHYKGVDCVLFYLMAKIITLIIVMPKNDISALNVKWLPVNELINNKKIDFDSEKFFNEIQDRINTIIESNKLSDKRITQINERFTNCKNQLNNNK